MSAQVSFDGVPEIHHVSNSLGVRYFFIGVLNGVGLNVERDLKCFLLKTENPKRTRKRSEISQ